MRRLPFFKLSGAGNDFVLIESSRARGAPSARLARLLCARRLGVGADGLLLVGVGAREVPSVRYFNADGSEAFCANGTRCAAWWLRRRRRLGPRAVLRTSRGPLAVAFDKTGRARVRMPEARVLRENLRVRALAAYSRADLLDTGVPHAVVAVRDLAAADVERLGSALRRHRAFGPAGANVDFVSAERGELSLRTYERGVEAETLACGTGAVAAALWAHRKLGFAPPVRVRTRGGDVLTVRFKARGAAYANVWLEGPTREIFKGEITL